MIAIVASTLLALVVVPLLALYWFTRGGLSVILWGLKATAIGGYIVATFYAGPWHMLSYYGRYVLLAALAVVVIHEAWRLTRWKTLLLPEGWHWLEALLALALLVVVVVGLTGIYRSHTVPPDPVDLTFPLQDGVFYVASGGSHSLMNPHLKVQVPGFEEWRGQTWAIDIVGLYEWGNRARGLYPARLDEYAIFGAPLYAPCDGRLEAAVDSLPDRVPPARDTTRKAGNYVVLQCAENTFVLLAHLQEGSIDVEPGDAISTGDRLGAVGNSGKSWEPHLHVSAQRSRGATTVLDADPRPITFDGEFLVRNDVVWDRPAY